MPRNIFSTKKDTTAGNLSPVVITLKNWAKQKLKRRKAITAAPTIAVAQPKEQHHHNTNTTEKSFAEPLSTPPNRKTPTKGNWTRGQKSKKLPNNKVEGEHSLSHSDNVYDTQDNYPYPHSSPRDLSPEPLPHSHLPPTLTLIPPLSFEHPSTEEISPLPIITPFLLPSEEDCFQEFVVNSDPHTNSSMKLGSVQHFIYIRTLKKLRFALDSRPLHQIMKFNIILRKLDQQLSNQEMMELCWYRERVTYLEAKEIEKREIERRRAIAKERQYLNQLPMNREQNKMTCTLVSSNETNAKPFESNKLPYLSHEPSLSKIYMDYRPPYASKTMVTTFDEELKDIVVHDLTIDHKNPQRNPQNVLKTAVGEENKRGLSLLKRTFNWRRDSIYRKKGKDILSASPRTINNICSVDDDDDNDDDISLYTLKERYRYSGMHSPKTSILETVK